MKLLGRNVTINFVDEHPIESNNMGVADSVKSKITVRKGMPKDVTNSTILHESMHIINDNLGLDLSEKQILGLESGIFSLLQDNGIEVEFTKLDGIPLVEIDMDKNLEKINN